MKIQYMEKGELKAKIEENLGIGFYLYIFFLLLAYSNIFSQAITDFLIPKELSENANAIVKESKEKLERSGVKEFFPEVL